jgi:nitroreductase
MDIYKTIHHRRSHRLYKPDPAAPASPGTDSRGRPVGPLRH